MPSASVRITVIDTPFALHSERTATLKSLRNSSGRKLMMYLQTSVTRVSWASEVTSDGAAPLFTFTDRAAKVLDGTNLPRAHFDPGMVGYQLNGMIEVSRLQDQNPSQEILCLDVGAVRHRHLTLLVTQSGGADLQSFSAHPVSIS